jgi:hypothetical protein
MVVLAEWDVNRSVALACCRFPRVVILTDCVSAFRSLRLQLFPIEAACQAGHDFLDNDDDREIISDGLKYLFFDSEGIKLNYWTEEMDAVSRSAYKGSWRGTDLILCAQNLCLPYADVISTTFIEKVVGACESSLLLGIERA